MFRVFTLRALCAVALLLVLRAPAGAATTPAPSPTPIPVIAHVQTADRSETTLRNSVRTVYVVTAEQIARNGYRTVGEAIASLPGVELAPYGAIGAAVSYGIRGSNSAQVLVLVDGLPAPGSLGNGVNLGVLPAAGVRRIEVVEGGGSTLYGTGAIGGIINIITDGRTPAKADLRVGSFGDREITAGADGFMVERIVSNNGYALPSGGATPATRANADYEATSVHAAFDRKLGGIEAALRAGLTSDHIGAPGPTGFFSSSSREDDVNANADLTLTRRRAHSTATLQLGGTRQQTAFGCDAVNDPNCYQPTASVSTESRTDFGVRNVVSGASERLIYGVDLSRGVVRSDSGGTATPGIAFAAIAQSAAYAQENVQLGGDSSVYAGIRGERDGALGGEFSPSAGARIALGAGLALKANYASAFRAPNAVELYFPGYGNPGLRPERARVGDLTLVDDRLMGGVSFGWFTNRTNDLIVPVEVDPVNFIYQPENIDRALLQGFTLDARTRPYHGVVTGLNVTDLYRAQDLVAQSRLPHDPVISLNLHLDISGGRSTLLHDAGIALRSVGANATVDPTQPLFDQAAAFTSVDAFARFRAGRHALLSLRGYNLGNERYAQVPGYPMPGRSFALELTTR